MIQTTVLDNGLKVVTETISRLKTASFGVWAGCGARNESIEINGISHLLEHMAFKGTTTRSAQDIVKTVERVGGYINAYTSHERTAYYLVTLGENAPIAIDVLSDILQHSTFPEKDLEKEKGVVCQEIQRYRDIPEDLVFDYANQQIYPNQALGRPIIGTTDKVKSFSRSDLQSYIQQYYHGENLILVATGDVNHEEIVHLAQEKFIDLPAKSKTAFFEPGKFHTAANIYLQDIQQTHAVLSFPGLAYADKQSYILKSLIHILAGGMSSRLVQKLREQHGLVYSVHGFVNSVIDSGHAGIYFACAHEATGKCLELVRQEWLNMLKNITPEELQIVQNQLHFGLTMCLENSFSRAEQIAKHMFYSQEVIPLEVMIQSIKNVTLEDMQAMVSTMIKQPNLSLLGQPPFDIKEAQELITF